MFNTNELNIIRKIKNKDIVLYSNEAEVVFLPLLLATIPNIMNSVKSARLYANYDGKDDPECIYLVTDFKDENDSNNLLLDIWNESKGLVMHSERIADKFVIALRLPSEDMKANFNAGRYDLLYSEDQLEFIKNFTSHDWYLNNLGLYDDEVLERKVFLYKLAYSLCSQKHLEDLVMWNNTNSILGPPEKSTFYADAI